MNLPPPIPGTDTVRHYVIGTTEHRRYTALAGGSFVRMPPGERAGFLRDLGRDARQVTDTELEFLLRPEWRSRTVAAWMIGVDRRERFRKRLGELLLASELTYACEGYCVALAMLGTREDAGLLVSYLDVYLRRPECRYDQPWALGALLHLDRALGSHRAAAFLEPDGLWEHWADERTPEPAQMERHIAQMCALADRYAPGTDEAEHH
ncbi:DUF6000 family protein [Embleya sp. NPDC001921]